MSKARVLRWGVLALVGLAVGVGTALLATSTLVDPMQTVPGHPEWRTKRASGTDQPSMYVRAFSARYGLMGLKRSEAIYYHTIADRQGRTLSSSCDYEITGQGLPVQWWSLTLYANDGFLSRNTDEANHIGSANVSAKPDGTWDIHIGATRNGAANWLSSRNSGANFVLTLRMYLPTQAVIDGEVPNLPEIQRTSCQGEHAS